MRRVKKTEKKLDVLFSLINKAGLTFEQVAERIHVSKASMSRWLHEDNIKLQNLVSIASCCGYDASFCMCRGDYPVESISVVTTLDNINEFILKSLTYYGLTLQTVSRLNKVNYNTIVTRIYRNRWNFGDMLSFADNLEMNVFIEFIPHSGTVGQVPKKGAVIYSVAEDACYVNPKDLSSPHGET
jgi:transcriptional regulator with XRE-family HTH domain